MEEERKSGHRDYLLSPRWRFPKPRSHFKKTAECRQLPAVKSGAAVSSRIEALRERLRALLGDEELLPVNFSAALDDDGNSPAPDETDIFETALPEKPSASEISNSKSQIRIWGLIGSPGVSRATRDGQFVFVNRRPVENRGVNYALIEGYHISLMKGRIRSAACF